MTPARVRACNRLARLAMRPGASPSCGSNTWRFTTMIVSIVVAADWADSRAGEPAARSAPAAPTASLFDQVNALVQRISGVAGGLVPFRKIQRRVHAARDLAQASRGQPERAPHRVGLEGVAEARDSGIRRNPGVGGPERVRHVLPQLAHPPEVERERQRVLVSLAPRGIEGVAGEPHVA